MEATTLGLGAYIALLLLAGSLALGVMVPAFIAEANYGLGRGKFWDKFAQQLAAMGVKVLLGFLLLLAPALVWVTGRVEDPMALALSSRGTVLRAALLPLLSGWLGMTVYSGTWYQLRRSKALHRVLGGVSLAALLAGSYCVMNVLSLWLPHTTETTAGSLWALMWYPAHWTVWPVWAAVAGNGVGAAGILGMGYLVLRRNRDDFGRDYYRFALPRAARWGPVLLVPVAILGGWLGFRGVAWDPLVSALAAVAGAAAVVGVFLQVRVIRSRHPLRLKVSVFAACLLAWILDAALVMFFLSGGAVV